jgi:hypothetical protein
MKHPIQKPVMVGKVLRFTENTVVQLLLEMLEKHGQGLNHLHTKGNHLPSEDWDQFNQLLGYSLSNAPINGDTKEAAYKMFKKGLSEEAARAEEAERQLDFLRDNMRDAVAALFKKHPNDFI